MAASFFVKAREIYCKGNALGGKAVAANALAANAVAANALAANALAGIGAIVRRASRAFVADEFS